MLSSFQGRFGQPPGAEHTRQTTHQLHIIQQLIPPVCCSFSIAVHDMHRRILTTFAWQAVFNLRQRATTPVWNNNWDVVEVENLLYQAHLHTVRRSNLGIYPKQTRINFKSSLPVLQSDQKQKGIQGFWGPNNRWADNKQEVLWTQDDGFFTECAGFDIHFLLLTL